MAERKDNQIAWGPDNPHPLSRIKTELVWEGKYDEYGNRRPVKLPTSPLPLQRIETIDEPRDHERAIQGDLFDPESFTRKAHRDDFRNLLIWGDNKLGRYERQWWQMERLKGADGEHRRIVLQFYKAAPLANPPSPLLHGKKGGAYVYVDHIDSIFTYDDLKSVAEAAQAAGGRELHCLSWKFEMEIAHKKQVVVAETGLDISLRYIPREIMEPNRAECQFFEAGYLEAKTINDDGEVDVELVRFTPALAEAPESEMSALRERAVKSPFDFIDFWAVDFDWSEDKPFEHHWQDFRTRKDRSLKTRSDIGWEYETEGKKRICVKVIDVFGVDTTTVIDMEI